MKGALLLLVLAPWAAVAQDEEGWGDGGDEVGFADTADAATPTTAAAAATSPWSLDGFIRSDLHFWAERFDDDGDPWAKDRRSLDLTMRYSGGDWRVVLGGHFEHDLVYAHGTHDEATIETYETRYLDGEQYVNGAFGSVDVTLGRQIVAWGEGDAASPLDIVNPRDLREPGLADLDDLRLPVLATRVGWFPGDHRIEAMVVHEQRFGERAPPLGEFSPLPSFIASNPMAASLLGGLTFRWRDTPGPYSESQNYLLRWVYKGPGIDLGLYAASVLDRQGVIVLDVVEIATAATDPDVDSIDLVLDHRRYHLAGTSGATTVDAFLFKWELVFDYERPFTTGDRTSAVPMLSAGEANVLTPMAGVTWRGLTDTDLALEWTQAFLLDAPDDLLFPADAPQLALRVTHEALRQRLRLAAAVSVVGYTAELGWFARAEANYEVFDGVRAGVGYVTYQPPPDDEELSFLSGLDNHDRVLAQLRWDFSLQ